MLEALKKEVLRVSRMAEDSELCQHGAGNFSIVDREKNLVAITPHAESRYAIEDKDIIIVDLDGNIVENLGNLSPSSETVVHVTVYKNRPDVNSVCHTHARRACTLAVMNQELKPVLFESLMYGGLCRVAPVEIPGTKEFANSVVKGLAGTSAVILQHHGLLTVGKTMYDAYIKSVYVEEVAEAFLRAAEIVGVDNVPHLPYDKLDYYMNELGIVG